jgi:lysophospholipase L1-like esterase
MWSFVSKPVSLFALVALSSTAASVARGEPKTSYKFSFGSGQPAAGFTRVEPGATYSKDTGYGFEPGAKLTANERGVSSDTPFYFSTAVPEGNYRVTVILGDAPVSSTTTVKAELRRLMLEHVYADAGQAVTRSFIVNVRTPEIAGGGHVKLKEPRESRDEAWAWDERLTLEFNGSHPSVDSIQIEPANVPTVFLLGDSTVCDQGKEPYASWGQMLTRFFKPDIAVANHAESGETLSSSTGAHRIDKVLSVMKPGDYLLIQYGHNDMKSKAPDAAQQYKATLKKWCELTKAKGATPVLITSMNRHTFEGGKVVNSLHEYPDMVREAAKEENVALIDLNAMSKTLYEALGPHESIRLFEHVGDDLSKFDGTHHSPYGAYEIAKCVIEGIRQTTPELAKHIVDGVPAFDPAKPDLGDKFDVPPSPVSTTTRPLGD